MSEFKYFCGDNDNGGREASICFLNRSFCVVLPCSGRNIPVGIRLSLQVMSVAEMTNWLLLSDR